MKFASAASSGSDLVNLLAQLCAECDHHLGDFRADLVLIFLTSHFEDESERIVGTLVRRYPSAVVLGCSGEGVIGPAGEYERIPALSLQMASLPGVRLKPFAVPAAYFQEATDAESWPRAVGAAPEEHPSFLFFGDPFSVPVNAALGAFNRAYPGRTVLGGMASGCDQPEQAVLIADDQVFREGAVGVALTGPIEVQAVVSQGCRPIGRPLLITQCARNIIHGLGGTPALHRLKEIVEELPARDKQLARQALFVGRVINEYQEQFARGDFLIRRLLGVDQGSGAIAVGEEMRVGATIQFHVRDGVSADEDLRQMLMKAQENGSPAGALLFSCNGRGTRMWSQPNHDVSVLREICGKVPVAGFFAAGEIGPIGGKNFIHGHTASVALIRPGGEDAKAS